SAPAAPAAHSVPAAHVPPPRPQGTCDIYAAGGTASWVPQLIGSLVHIPVRQRRSGASGVL
ncbi:MAG TPA: hypothetical protein VGK85_04840, partial [Myxococcaceae bacterium]